MKKVLFILLSAAVLFSCGGRSDKFGRSAGHGGTKQIIEAHIDTMGTRPWDRKVYDDILENQINVFKGSPNAKSALKHKLDYVYGVVLVREGNTILDDCQKSRHKRLSSVMKELDKFPEAENAAPLKDRYARHEKICRFVGGMYAKQKVSAYDEKYESAFEQTTRKQAEEYLRQNLTCSYLKNNLSNTEKIFRDRRLDYASQIVALYCRDTVYQRIKEAKVRSNITSACGSVPSDIDSSINEHKDKYRRPE